MRILYINTFDPYIELHGGATVTRRELELLSEVADVTTLFGMPIKRRLFRLNLLRLMFDVATGMSLKLASYNILHRPRSFLEKFDLVFCNHDFAAYDFAELASIGKPFVVRKLNMEYRFYSQDAFPARIERRRIREFEEKLGAVAAAIIHLSSSEFADDNYSLNKHHLFPPLVSDEMLRGLSPIGLYSFNDRPIDVLCVTNYEWKPNREGFDWFFSNVLSFLPPGIGIHLVGKGSNRYAGVAGVTAHGYVEDTSHFYRSAKVFVAPVLSGAGIKIKNLEAMIFGVPVLSTPVGADGLADVAAIGGMSVASTGTEFSRELQAMLGDEARCSAQREKALAWVRSNVCGPTEWKSRMVRILEAAVKK